MLGVLLAPWLWAFGVGLVIVAVLAATCCLAFRVGPPGPVFFVLTYGLSGNITSVTEGVRDNDPVIFLLALLTGVLFSYLVAIVPLVIPRVRREPAQQLRDLLPGPWLERGEGTLILRVGIAALIGTVLSLFWLDPVHAYWTVTASVAVVGLSATRAYAIGRGLHRMLGTVLGAGCYILFVPLGTEPWVLIPLLAALQFTIEFIVVRNYAVALIFITPLVLLITSAATGETDLMGTALARVVDTIAGALLAMATSFMHRR